MSNPTDLDRDFNWVVRFPLFWEAQDAITELSGVRYEDLTPAQRRDARKRFAHGMNYGTGQRLHLATSDKPDAVDTPVSPDPATPDRTAQSPVVCETCGEEAPTRGSVAGTVHRWGPTDHPFEPVPLAHRVPQGGVAEPVDPSDLPTWEATMTVKMVEDAATAQDIFDLDELERFAADRRKKENPDA